jgi:hypothetical protein
MRNLLMLGALVLPFVVGCKPTDMNEHTANGPRGPGSSADGGVAAPDLALVSLAPRASHVGADGATCCMVTHGADAVLYLVNATSGTGELHVATAAGDARVATGVAPGSYSFSPDGQTILYLLPGTVSGRFSLQLARAQAPAAVATALANLITSSAARRQRILFAERQILRVEYEAAYRGQELRRRHHRSRHQPGGGDDQQRRRQLWPVRPLR